MLDHGAAGVIVPRVEGVADAERAERATRYAGTRGLDPGSRASAFGRDAGYGERADDERVLMVQIETRGALEAAEEIAALEGVDALFVGPYDLGVALGVTPGAATPGGAGGGRARRRRGARARQGRRRLPRRPGARARLPRARLHADQRRLHEPAAGRRHRRDPGARCGRDPAPRPHRPARRDRRGGRRADRRRGDRERAGRGRRARSASRSSCCSSTSSCASASPPRAIASARRRRARSTTAPAAGPTTRRNSSSFLSIAPIMGRPDGYDVLSSARRARPRRPRRAPPDLPPPQPANRKELDSQRVLARLLDGLVAGAPAIVFALGVGRSLQIFLVSLTLAYFFLCEALWGQTIGKRRARAARADARRPPRDRQRRLRAHGVPAHRRRPDRPRS